MILRIPIFLLTLFIITPIVADNADLNNSTINGVNHSDGGNTSELNTTLAFRLYGENLTSQGNETIKNLTDMSETESSLTNPLTSGNKKNQNEVSPTPTPVYKLSIGSVYDADYKEPEPRTFTYSGCGS